MEFPSFISIPVTTMVGVSWIDCELNLEILFRSFEALPHGSVPLPKKGFPHMAPGSVLSLRYNKRLRGLVEPGGKDFKNAIMIDFSIADKNINVRISSTCIHICGAKSLHHFTETLNILKTKLDILNSFYTYLREHQAEAKEVTDYIQSIVMYDPNAINRCSVYLPIKEEHISRFNEMQLNMIKIAQNFLEIRDAVEGKYTYTSCLDFLGDLEWILLKNGPLYESLTVGDVKISMINKNYKLGFNIDRRELAKTLTQYPNFRIRYDTAMNHYVRIEIPFTIDEGSNIHRKNRNKKKPENNSHAFTVYRSGSVTQTGPNFELMEEAYMEFNRVMREIRPLIESNQVRPKEEEHISGSDEISIASLSISDVYE